MDMRIAASDTMLKRIKLMAIYIKMYHSKEFEWFWDNNWKGDANAKETLTFFSQRNLEKLLIITTRIDIERM